MAESVYESFYLPHGPEPIVKNEAHAFKIEVNEMNEKTKLTHYLCNSKENRVGSTTCVVLSR